MPKRPPVLFQLYGAYQRAGRLVSQALAGTGIAPEDAPVYNVLERSGTITPTELGRVLGLAPSTVTYRTKALEARGHVERVENPDDGRSALLGLTPAGLRAWRAVFPTFVAAIRAAEDRLDVPQADVGRSLVALTDALDAELADRRRRRRRAQRAGRAGR